MSRLSTTLLNAAKSVPSSARHSANKVWLDDVHAAYCRQAGSRITFANFSQSIVADLDCRLLMARCDMPFTNRAKCDASDVVYYSTFDREMASFNFVKLPAAVTSIEADLRAILLDSSACQGLRSSL